MRRYMKPLIDAAIQAVLLSPPNSEHRTSINIKWARKNGVTQLPEGFPRGAGLGYTDTYQLMRYDCEKLLQWFQDNLYIHFNASTLLRTRQGVMMGLGRMETEIEKMLAINEEFLYNDVIE